MSTKANILLKISDFVPSSESRLFVAYSGGLDSTVLLHLLAHSEWKPFITALHVHHGLSENADAWEQHCRKHCEELDIPLHVHRANLATEGKGLEAAARRARYDFFESHMSHANSVLLTAHHADDQAETLLFRLLRGTGLRGLAGIRASRVFANGKIVRPLLHQTRDDLLAYAEAQGLSWVEDESNESLRFDRNFLRSEAVPVLKKRWPEASTQIAKAAGRLADSQALLSEYLSRDLKGCELRRERCGESIAIEPFSEFSIQKQRALLMHWAESLSFSIPESVHLEQLSGMIAARIDGNPALNWGNAELRRYKGRLHLFERLTEQEQREWYWDGRSELELGSGFVLSNGGTLQNGEILDLRIALREEGLRCRPKGRAHSQTLKKLLQEHELEPWLRGRVPLIYQGDELCAVGDLWLCESSLDSELLSPVWARRQ